MSSILIHIHRCGDGKCFLNCAWFNFDLKNIWIYYSNLGSSFHTPSGLPRKNPLQWTRLQHVCSCVLAHVAHFNPCPHFISPPPSCHSLPLSWKGSVPPALYIDAKSDLVWLSSAWLSPAQATSWAGRARCCVVSQPACRPSVSVRTQLKSDTTENLRWRRWNSFSLQSFLCTLSATKISRRGLPLSDKDTQSNILPSEVTTWSDVTAARAARSKASIASLWH